MRENQYWKRRNKTTPLIQWTCKANTFPAIHIRLHAMLVNNTTGNYQDNPNRDAVHNRNKRKTVLEIYVKSTATKLEEENRKEVLEKREKSRTTFKQYHNCSTSPSTCLFDWKHLHLNKNLFLENHKQQYTNITGHRMALLYTTLQFQKPFERRILLFRSVSVASRFGSCSTVVQFCGTTVLRLPVTQIHCCNFCLK